MAFLYKSMAMLLLLLAVQLFFNLCSSHNFVDYLPGFSGKLPFTLQTGYIGLGENEEVQLFYYFIESENKPQEDPLVLWLTGGPGCSALSGLVYEIGPFTIDYANSYGSIPSLKVNEYSWTKVANIIFLDQPVGTGFSYSETLEGYYSSDTTSASHTYDFLRKWLTNNPKYLKNPLYINGDSYSGLTIPLIVDKVYDGIELGSEPLMNMKGYALGNPVTDMYSDPNGRIPYVHRMGFLSDRLYQCIEKIRWNHILEPWCDRFAKQDTHVVPERVISYKDIPTYDPHSFATTKKSWCRDDNYVFVTKWANDKSVQKALHVREGKITEWTRCNSTIVGTRSRQDGMPYVYNITSTIRYHKKFTNKSCRTLIYSGDHDIWVPHISTEKWIDSLNLPIRSDWRPWFVDSQVAGYAMTCGHSAYELTYATIKGGGHTAPEYKPIECLSMMRRWFSKTAL